MTFEYPSEYLSATGDPYHPVPRDENAAPCRECEAVARATPDGWFVGRAANCKSLNRDQVVGQALARFERIPKAAAEQDVTAAKTASGGTRGHLTGSLA